MSELDEAVNRLSKLPPGDLTDRDAHFEIARLRTVMREFADRIERRAFEISPPNPYTPDLVLLAQQLRGACYK